MYIHINRQSSHSHSVGMGYNYMNYKAHQSTTCYILFTTRLAVLLLLVSYCFKSDTDRYMVGICTLILPQGQVVADDVKKKCLEKRT